MKRTVLAALVLVLGALPVSPQVQRDERNEAGIPFLRAWGTKEYGGSAQNWALAQDNRGVVYVANGGGVIEYDGLRWRAIPTANRTTARSLAVDSTGRMYVGAVGDVGYLEPNAGGEMRFVSMLERIPSGDRTFSDVFQTFVTPQGVVFSSFERLFVFHNDEIKAYKPEKVFHFAFFARDRIFVRDEGRGLLELREGTLQMVPGGAFFADERIYLMLPWDSPGDARSAAILVGTRTRGLFILDGSSLRPFVTAIDADLKRDLLFSGARLPDGSVALGTIQGGLYVIDREGHLLAHLNKAAGLPDDCVWGQYVDREGGLWLGLDRGLARVQITSPLTRFDERAGLPGMVISLRRNQGLLYAGTSHGVFRLDPGSPARFEPVAGIQNQTWGFLPYDDALLVANNDGVYELRNNRATLIHKGDGASALAASRVAPGRVFVGLTDGVISMHREANRWVDEGPVPGVSGDVRKIIEMPGGQLWIATYSTGILRVTFPTDGASPRVETFGTADGLPSPNGSPSYPVLGEILFGTRQGIYRFDEARRVFEPDPRFASLFPTRQMEVVAIREDSKGRIWVHAQDPTGGPSETGEAIRLADGTWRFAGTALRALDGSTMLPLETDDDGVVWLGGDDGLVRFDPRIDRAYGAKFRALVREVGRIGSKDRHYGGAGPAPTPVLEYGQNALRFEYAAPTFDAPEATRFRVLLEGYDREWTDWSREGYREYTNLREGDYQFRVRARNIYGTLSEEAVYAFTVTPPWFRTRSAYLAGVLLLALFGGVIVQWRLRRVESEKRALEETVAERTRDVRARNDQLETLNAIVKSINEQPELDAMLAAMLRECRVIRGMEKATALVRLPETDLFTVRATLGFASEELEGVELRLEEAEARYIANAEEVSPDVFLVRGLAGRAAEAKLRLRVVPQALLVMRIRIDDHVEGYLVFENQKDEQAFDAHDLDVLRALREHFVSAFQKARSLRLLDLARRSAEEARVRAELASHAKSAFLANMSHELRTPLHGVLGFAQLMDRVPDRSETDRQHLATILKSGEHLLGLINDVLSVSKIEAGQMSLRPAPFDLGSMVDAVVSLVRVSAEARDLFLRTERGELPVVVGDETKLRQVLFNLLANGVKFTEQGGVTLRTSWRDGRAVFEVEDTGPGISGEEIEGLFSTFAQTDRGRRTAEGSGLGLALARQFARLMDGDITVESEVGRGSTFRLEVSLPSAAPDTELTTRGNRGRVLSLAPDQPRPRVLVVDDIAENRALLHALLAAVGFEVREAADGAEAIEVWRTWIPHLVWMDKRMPGVDGLEATRAIRDEERNSGRPRTVILALSASALEHERDEILAAGCDDFVPKPFREGAIFEKMANHLGLRYLHEATPSDRSSSEPREITAERLAGLSPTWRRLMREALSTGDMDTAAALARGVEPPDPRLTRDLLALLAAFRIDPLQEALNGEGAGPA